MELVMQKTSKNINLRLKKRCICSYSFRWKCNSIGEDILEPDNRIGTSQTSKGMTINNDGKVNQEGVTSSYRIVNGNGNEYIRASYDESYGKRNKI